jgi:hypothetical protein
MTLLRSYNSFDNSAQFQERFNSSVADESLSNSKRYLEVMSGVLHEIMDNEMRDKKDLLPEVQFLLIKS